MLHRRAERCRLRAAVALEAGYAEEAAEALEEARRLEPDAPENAPIERLLAEGPPRPPATGWRRIADTARTISIMATILIASAVCGWIAFSWMGSHRAAITSAIGMNQKPERAGVGVPMADTSQSAGEGTSAPTATVVTQLIQPKATFGDVSAAPPPIAGSSQDMAPQAQVPLPQFVSPQPIAPEPALREAAPTEQPSTQRGTDVPSAPAGGSPPPAVVAELPRRSTTPVDTEPRSPRLPAEAPASLSVTVVPRTSPSATVDETGSVRSVLARYEAAYSGLDANAASAVWPQVDRRALARAFDTLESQRISLGRCDVNVRGAAARAQCSGSATWTPKVGRGPQTQARAWNFDLAKQGDAWIIQSATVK